MSKFLKATIIVSLFLLLFFGYFHTISALTQDLGRHLLSGEIILKSHHVPKTNLFSYTYPTFPFINHHWLSEVIFYLIFKILSFNGLLVLTVVLVLASFLLLFVYLFKKSNTFALSIASLLYLPILFERTDIRPEIFSFLFLSIFMIILYKYKENFTKWIFVLPIIELLWVNIHIYFAVGIAVIVLFLIDIIVYHIKNPNTKILNLKQIQITKNQNSKHSHNLKGLILNIVSSFDIRILSLTLTLIISILATFLNPNGLKGSLYPFSVFQNYGYSIQENQNIFFLWNYSHNAAILFFAISSIASFITLIFAFKKTSLVDWLLTIIFTIIAASAIRNFPLFVFATFIPFVKSLSFVSKKVFAYTKRQFFLSQTKTAFVKLSVLSLILLLILLQIRQTIQAKQIGFGLEKGASGAVNFFLKNRLKGPIFNNFDVGSYLEYRLYPKEKVFVDGRPEAYPASFFKSTYIPMQQDPVLFEKLSEKYNFNLIFFLHTDQTPWATLFLQQIIKNKNWAIIYFDDYTIILVKNDVANERLIRKFAMGETNLRIDNFNPQDFNSLLRLAVFFNKVKWINWEIAMYEDLLSIKPHACPILYNLTTRLIQQQSPLFNIYLTRYNSYCK